MGNEVCYSFSQLESKFIKCGATDAWATEFTHSIATYKQEEPVGAHVSSLPHSCYCAQFCFVISKGYVWYHLTESWICTNDTEL